MPGHVFNHVGRSAQRLVTDGHGVAAMTLESFSQGILVEAGGATATELLQRPRLVLHSALIVRKSERHPDGFRFSAICREFGSPDLLVDQAFRAIAHYGRDGASIPKSRFRRMRPTRTLAALFVCEQLDQTAVSFFLHHPSMGILDAVVFLNEGFKALTDRLMVARSGETAH